MDDNEYKDVKLQPYEYRIETTRGTGNGGQKRNKTETCVVITHIETGIKVRIDSRSQKQNKENALLELTKRVNDFYRTGNIAKNIKERQKQVGRGLRAEKRRTYNVKSDRVIDHITGKRASLKKVLRGELNLLH